MRNIRKRIEGIFKKSWCGFAEKKGRGTTMTNSRPFLSKMQDDHGMTMGELLVVVAIMGILSSVAFISVAIYQRSMAQLERDALAREIFVAAQNHLTAAYGEGYNGITGYGEFESAPGNAAPDQTVAPATDTENKNRVYYYVVNKGTASEGAGDMFNYVMLPFGSVDETIRTGGSYIIRYQPGTATVLDVFYCSDGGSPVKFNHTLSKADYNTAYNLRDTDSENHKDDRRDWEGAVLGWYGGTNAAELKNSTLDAPTISIVNKEKLFVKLTDNNKTKDSDVYQKASLRLIIKGVLSETEHYYTLYDQDTALSARATEYTIVLDEITKTPATVKTGWDGGGHFSERLFDDMKVSDANNGFIPGEDIKIQAISFSTVQLANIASTSWETRNSLFAGTGDNYKASYGAANAGADSIVDTAYISNIRHLENLDIAISNLDGRDTNNKLNIFAARQNNNLDWENFKSEIKKMDGNNPIHIYGLTDTTKSGTEADCYYPLVPTYELHYDGLKYRISNIVSNGLSNAGLFGSTTNALEVKNLELLDFSITGTESAGALGGSFTGNATVSNVIAHNSNADRTANITSTGNSGGLVGSIKAGTVEYSAAALTVTATGNSSNAGGLIGKVDEAAPTINCCYSGGHTVNGEYYVTNATDGSKKDPIYNITGGATAGGLIGNSGSAVINNSYSTCSVDGTLAGGFVGTGTGSITKCYATGLVKTDNLPSTGDTDPRVNSNKGAFAGAWTSTSEDSLHENEYYSIINEVLKDSDAKASFDHYLEAVGDSPNAGVHPLDDSTTTYEEFVGNSSRAAAPAAGASEDEVKAYNSAVFTDGWQSANTYDSKLVEYYGGKYCLRTVYQLYHDVHKNDSDISSQYMTDSYFVRNHYGDWPAPEIMIINQKASSGAAGGGTSGD